VVVVAVTAAAAAAAVVASNVGYLNNTNNTIYITNTIYNSGRLINRVKEVNFIKFHRFNVSITFHNITSHSVRMLMYSVFSTHCMAVYLDGKAQ